MNTLAATIDELDEVRAEITRLHKVKRETEWRSEAYRAQLDIDDLTARRKVLRRRIRDLT